MNDEVYSGYVTRRGAECQDLHAVKPYHPDYIRLGGKRGQQEFHLCAFGTFKHPRFEWVNAGNVRPSRRPSRMPPIKLKVKNDGSEEFKVRLVEYLGLTPA